MLSAIQECIIQGKIEEISELTAQALRNRYTAEEILNRAMIPAMREVGRLFEVKEYYLPEMLMAAHTMKTGVAIIKPLLTETDVKPIGSVVAGTVRGDVHDIGKNLVCMLLEGAGFKIHDLGVNVPPKTFVEAIQKIHPEILALSALLTTTMPNMKVTIDTLIEANARDGIIVLVGGAPITKDYAEKIGADGYAENAGAAVTVAKSLLGIS